MTYREAALKLLKERGPMHYQDLADAMVAVGLVQTDASTPTASLNAMIAVDIKRKGKQSPFVRIKPGVFGLRDQHQDEVLASVDEDAAAMRDPGPRSGSLASR